MSDSAAEVVHWVGPVVIIGPRVRQRCMWCGALLRDDDLSRISVAIPPGKTEEQARADGDLDIGAWEPGAWLAVDGPTSCIVRSVAEDAALGAGAETPERSCCRLDPDVT